MERTRVKCLWGKWLSQSLLMRLLVAMVCVMSSSFASFAMEGANLEEDVNLETGAEEEGGRFSYIMEDRADPFIPFITEKSATAEINMNEIVDDGAPLVGMQLFEPGQLSLVALMRTGGRDVAMVEDFTGKGYVLVEGMKIGRHGVIVDIASNSVLIEEVARTRAGKEIITKKVMTLKKEEGEK